MTEKYFFDTDCLSAFLWVREESILAKLYAGRIILPAQVYNELKKVPHLLARADTLKSNGDLLVESMEVGSEEYKEYLRMTTSPEPEPVPAEGNARPDMLTISLPSNKEEHYRVDSARRCDDSFFLCITLPNTDQKWSALFPRKRQ